MNIGRGYNLGPLRLLQVATSVVSQVCGARVKLPEAQRAALRAFQWAMLPPEAAEEALDEMLAEMSRFYAGQLDIYRREVSSLLLPSDGVRLTSFPIRRPS